MIRSTMKGIAGQNRVHQMTSSSLIFVHVTQFHFMLGEEYKMELNEPEQ